MYERLTMEDGERRTVKPVTEYRTAVGNRSFSARFLRIWELLPSSLKLGDCREKRVQVMIKNEIRTWDKEWVLWGKKRTPTSNTGDHDDISTGSGEGERDENPSEGPDVNIEENMTDNFLSDDGPLTNQGRTHQCMTSLVLIEMNEMYVDKEEHEACLQELYLTECGEESFGKENEEEREDLQSLLEADWPQQQQPDTKESCNRGNVSQGVLPDINFYNSEQEAERPLSDLKQLISKNQSKMCLVSAKLMMIATIDNVLIERQRLVMETLAVNRCQELGKEGVSFVGTGFVT